MRTISHPSFDSRHSFGRWLAQDVARWAPLFALMSAAFLSACFGSSNLVANPGFEVGSDQNVSQWTVNASSANADYLQYRVDDERYSGSQSLRIDNLKDNDSQAYQEIRVRGERVYRVSGWIKTSNVQETPSARIGANLCIPGTWVRSASLKGTQGWTPVEFYVRTSPERTSLKIACRLGYEGSPLSGTAWFDNIVVKEVPSKEVEGLPVY